MFKIYIALDTNKTGHINKFVDIVKFLSSSWNVERNNLSDVFLFYPNSASCDALGAKSIE